MPLTLAHSDLSNVQSARTAVTHTVTQDPRAQQQQCAGVSSRDPKLLGITALLEKLLELMKSLVKSTFHIYFQELH